MECILVAGATGATGEKVVKLVNQSENYRAVALVRNKEQKEQWESQGVETVMGDLTKDVSHTTKGIDKVVFAAGSGGKNVVECGPRRCQKAYRRIEKGTCS